MDSPTSAAPDEKPPELASATQLSKENLKPSGPLEISAERFNSSVGRLTSNSIDGLQALVSELQRMQEFLNSEVDKVQRQIDSALAGINIIVETIGPWKSIASSQTSHPIPAMPARDWRPILSNVFALDSNGRERAAQRYLLVRESTRGLPRKQAEVTGKHSAEFPNTAQRAVMQCLSLDDWKLHARLPIPAGELMLSRIRNYR